MLYLACTIISSVDLAQYGPSRAKDWVSVDCGTIIIKFSLKMGENKRTKIKTEKSARFSVTLKGICILRSSFNGMIK